MQWTWNSKAHKLERWMNSAIINVLIAWSLLVHNDAKSQYYVIINIVKQKS